MSIVEHRRKILFLPLVRSFFNKELGKRAKKNTVEATKELGLDAIFPEDHHYTDGSICSDKDVQNYYNTWKSEIYNIKALIVIGGNFMEERGFQDTLRCLPADVPVFLIFQNDQPSKMNFDNRGDALCGSLSIHRNAEMLGRGVLCSRGMDLGNKNIFLSVLKEFQRIINGIENLRNMRVAMIGVNPVEFTTTFVNQMELFRLGFSIHTYELIDLWGATVLAGKQHQFGSELTHIFPAIKPDHPIYPNDPRIAETKKKLDAMMKNSHIPQDKVELMIRCFLWIKDIFERDRIDTGGIHCWTSFERYFQITPCTFSIMANSVLGKPLVCETDICHAIMTRLAWAMTGEPGVILDINNPGWDPRVFNVFHCSQTPPEWMDGSTMVNQTIIEGDEAVGRGNAFGAVAGNFVPVPFTGISAATTADAFHATVFQGQILKEKVDSFGSNGWAFVPNLQDVLDDIHKTGIHHFVVMKGHLGSEVSRVLGFKGIKVNNRSVEVPDLKTIEKELGTIPKAGRQICAVHSR